MALADNANGVGVTIFVLEPIIKGIQQIGFDEMSVKFCSAAEGMIGKGKFW